MAWGRFRTFYLWPFRLSVRTLGFQPKKTGSIPVGATKHINLSTRTANDGLNKIQFRTAGSRMLESVFNVGM